MIIWAVKGQDTMVGEQLVGTTITYSYENKITIKNISGEFDDAFELPLAKQCNIDLIRVKCIVIIDPPIIEKELVEVPLTYYLQKECTMYIRSVDGIKYEPIKIPVTYNFLKIKLIESVIKQKQMGTTIESESHKLNIQNETVNKINTTTLSIDNNKLNENLNTNNTSVVTTTSMHMSSVIIPKVTTDQTAFNNYSDTITESNELNYTKSITEVDINENVTESKYIIQNNNTIDITTTSHTKIKNYKSISYIMMYVISGIFMITVMLAIMIVHKNYKLVNRNRYRYAMHQLMVSPEVELSEL